MQIYGASNVHGPQALKGPHTPQRTTGPTPSSPTSGPTDQLDISPAAEAAASAADSGAIRSELVNRVRSEIAAGTYESPDKIAIAIEGLADDVS